jgi:hypothetical protein
MSARVSLSRKTAAAFMALEGLTVHKDDPATFKALRDVIFGLDRAFAELRAALRPRPVKALKKARREKTKEKRATKREETAAIRAGAFALWDERCAFCGLPAEELHHVFGRVRQKQTARNCLPVCSLDHHAITNNRPSAAYWWERTAKAFDLAGFSHESSRARNRLSFVQARAELSAGAR